MTEIYLIRHAEAEGNIFRRLHGQYDSLLTPRGHRQVDILAKRFENLRIDACFSSDLTRACLTSRAIYVPKRLKLHRDDRFREVDVGIWEDLPYGYLDNFEEDKMHAFTKDPPAWIVEGAESFEEYTTRFLEGLKAAAETYDGGTIAVFSHGAVIRSTLMRLFFMDDLSKLPFSDNTGVSKLIYDKGNFSFRFLNDNSHIPPELSTFYIQRWWRETDNRKESGLYFLEQPSVERQKTFAAILRHQQVGSLTLARGETDVGTILDVSLQPEYEGRYYGDQLLGQAFSYFRRQGCRWLCLKPGKYPDDIFSRYDFDSHTGMRNIDLKIYEWDVKIC